MSKWEYHIEKTDSICKAIAIVGKLQQLGKEGWELVTVINNTAGVILHYFKRAKHE